MTSVTTRVVHSVEQNVSAWAAEMNLRAQENLFSTICGAQASSGKPIEDVAARLGISKEETLAALRGETDLTLTEVRLLSVACDVVITYTARPAADLHSRWLSRLSKRVHDDHESEGWDQVSLAHSARVYIESTR